MQTLRSNVVRRSPRAQGGLVLGLLAVAASACAGCGQPRSFLDNTVMREQSRDAEYFWGPDGLAGHAPLAYRASAVRETPAQGAPALVAQTRRAASDLDLFPTTYRTVPLPQSDAPALNERALAAVAAPPSASPSAEAVVNTAYEPPRIETPVGSEMSSQTVTHVTSRPRDDGLLLTSLDESEVLPPLPDAPETGPAAELKGDWESLPPLPPGMD